MLYVVDVREEKRAIILAVTHVDGTGRLQTVHRAVNPRYYTLIEALGHVGWGEFGHSRSDRSELLHIFWQTK